MKELIDMMLMIITLSVGLTIFELFYSIWRWIMS
jgi:hypothetical protein